MGRRPRKPGKGSGGDSGEERGKRALRADIERLLDGQIVRALSPGFYFQRCLEIWKALEDEEVETISEKAAVLKDLDAGQPGRIAGDAELYSALLSRQEALFGSLFPEENRLELWVRNRTPFVTGIGQPHPLETGFAFLKPYGVPYLAGSGVKGAVRAACRKIWCERYPKDGAEDRLLHFFGSVKKEPARKDPRVRGALVFLDVLPHVNGWNEVFRVDLVNPHYKDYYATGKADSPPADWISPQPSYFLTLKPGLEWRIRIGYVGDGRYSQNWREEIRDGLLLALCSRGLGAKKSWGYGLFDIERVVPEMQGWVVGGTGQPAKGAMGAPPPVRSRADELVSQIEAIPGPRVRGEIARFLEPWEALEDEADRIRVAKAIERRVGRRWICQRADRDSRWAALLEAAGEQS